ncbi:MAG: hypothetical protein ACLPZM_00935 [Thermoplasmata archaeon]
MAPLSRIEVPRRSLPRGGPPLSLLGLVVDTGLGTVSGPGIIARLRQARSAGVTTFDVAGAARPSEARWLLAEAFPTPDPDLVVILDPAAENEEPLAPSTTPLPATFTRAAPSGRPDPGLFPSAGTIIYEVRSVGTTSTGGEGDENSPAVTGSRNPFRALRLDLEAERLPDTPGVSLFSGPLSLLDGRVRLQVERTRPTRPFGLLARDPFAAGRLDGTRFSGNWLERGPAAAPSSLRSLSADFEPVLRLGFLTSARQRTLAQAALQYASYYPWVSCVLAPLPGADRLDELLSAFERPPLTESEVARIEGSAGPRSTT